jgi:hypothetical protein
MSSVPEFLQDYFPNDPLTVVLRIARQAAGQIRVNVPRGPAVVRHF